MKRGCFGSPKKSVACEWHLSFSPICVDVAVLVLFALVSPTTVTYACCPFYLLYFHPPRVCRWVYLRCDWVRFNGALWREKLIYLPVRMRSHRRKNARARVLFCCVRASLSLFYGSAVRIYLQGVSRIVPRRQALVDE